MVVFIVAGMSVIDSPPVVSAPVADAELVRVLDQLDHTSIIALTDTDLFASISVKTGLLARLQAFLDAELVEAETRGVTQTAFGVTTATWLAVATNAVDGRHAGRRIKQAVDIGTRFPVLQQAMRAGRVRAGRRHLHRPAPPPHRPRRRSRGAGGPAVGRLRRQLQPHRVAPARQPARRRHRPRGPEPTPPPTCNASKPTPTGPGRCGSTTTTTSTGASTANSPSPKEPNWPNSSTHSPPKATAPAPTPPTTRP